MLSVSILQVKNKEQLTKLDKLDFDFLHVDVMDNKFVTNITRDYEDIKNLLKIVSILLMFI